MVLLLLKWELVLQSVEFVSLGMGLAFVRLQNHHRFPEEHLSHYQSPRFLSARKDLKGFQEEDALQGDVCFPLPYPVTNRYRVSCQKAPVCRKQGGREEDGMWVNGKAGQGFRWRCLMLLIVGAIKQMFVAALGVR